MSLASVSIRNPVFAWMLMVGIILVGAVGLTRLGVGLMPDVDLPTVSVSATLEGADPEIMESQVVDVLEDAVMSVAGIKEVMTLSQVAFGSIACKSRSWMKSAMPTPVALPLLSG